LTRRSIVFLGTASSIPNPQRFTQSIAICGSRDCILLDAGEGVQIRLASVGIDHRDVKIVALSHIHGDHIYGVLPFIESLAMKISSQKNVSTTTLRIVAPKNVCRYLLNSIDVIKMGGMDKVLSLECIEAGFLSKEGLFVESPNKDIAVYPVPVDHCLEEAYGYFVKIKLGKVELGVYYSGDGVCREQCLNILKILKPSIVIHEATFLDYADDEARAVESCHSTVSNAAQVASNINAKVLILTHISARYRGDELRDFISRARKIFSGEVYIAQDLSKIPLDFINVAES